MKSSATFSPLSWSLHRIYNRYFIFIQTWNENLKFKYSIKIQREWKVDVQIMFEHINIFCQFCIRR